MLTISRPGDDQTGPAALDGARDILVFDQGPAADAYEATIADPDRRIAARLGLPNGGRVLVRPDGYIGVVTDLDDTESGRAYLRRLAL